MANNCLKLQQAPLSKPVLTIFYKKMLSARQIRHLWVASDITISLSSYSHFWTLLSPAETVWSSAALGNQPKFSKCTCFIKLSRGSFEVLICGWLKVGKWADLCGTAMQSQLAIDPEQAPDDPSPCKNKFNIEEDTWSSYQILSW